MVLSLVNFHCFGHTFEPEIPQKQSDKLFGPPISQSRFIASWFVSARHLWFNVFKTLLLEKQQQYTHYSIFTLPWTDGQEFSFIILKNPCDRMMKPIIGVAVGEFMGVAVMDLFGLPHKFQPFRGHLQQKWTYNLGRWSCDTVNRKCHGPFLPEVTLRWSSPCFFMALGCQCCEGWYIVIQIQLKWSIYDDPCVWTT